MKMIDGAAAPPEMGGGLGRGSSAKFVEIHPTPHNEPVPADMIYSAVRGTLTVSQSNVFSTQYKCLDRVALCLTSLRLFGSLRSLNGA